MTRSDTIKPFSVITFEDFLQHYVLAEPELALIGMSLLRHVTPVINIYVQAATRYLILESGLFKVVLHVTEGIFDE